MTTTMAAILVTAGLATLAPTHAPRPAAGGEAQVQMASALGMVAQGERRRKREAARCESIRRKIEEQLALKRPAKQGAKRMAQLMAQKAENKCEF